MLQSVKNNTIKTGFTMYINDLIHLFQLITPDSGVLLNAAIDFFITEKAALNWEKVEPGTYDFDMPTAVHTVTQHVQLEVQEAIVLFDPCHDTEENKKTLRRIFDDYLAENEKHFLHSEYEVDDARIWPRFHLINDKYIAFTRFGYIRDRIGHNKEKQGYRLEFLNNNKLGKGSYGTVSETATIIPEGNDSVIIDYKDHGRCVKATCIDEKQEVPFAEVKILNQLPYAEYKKKNAILYIQYGVKMLLIPQKLHPGMSLSRYLHMYRLNTQSALAITALVLEQVDHLRELGIIHRDIKPANIIYDPHTNTLRLIDFGFATFAHDRFKLKRNTGTRFFMAPETFGEPPDYSYASDVYAATITMRRIFNFFPKDDIEGFDPKARFTEKSYTNLQRIRIKYFDDCICDLSSMHHALLVTTYKEGTEYLHGKRAPLIVIRQSIADILESMELDYPQVIANELNEQLQCKIEEPKKGMVQIFKACQYIRTDAASIKTFIDTLSLDFLKHCTSLNGIRKCLRELVDAYEILKPSLPLKNAMLAQCIAKLEEKIKRKSSSSALIQNVIYHLREIEAFMKNPKTLADWQKLVIKYRDQAIADVALLATTYLVDQITTSSSVYSLLFRRIDHQSAYSCLQTLCSDQPDSAKLDAIFAYTQKRPDKEQEQFLHAIEFASMPALARWIDNKKLELSTHCVTYQF